MFFCRKHGHKALACKLRGRKRRFTCNKIGHKCSDCWSNSYSTDRKFAAKVSAVLQRYKSDPPDSASIEERRNEDSAGHKVRADDASSARSKPCLGKSVSRVADSKMVSVVCMKIVEKPPTVTRNMPVVKGKIGRVSMSCP